MNIYDFTVKDAQGRDVALADYRGKVLLIVNTATRCGLTPQYEELQKLYAQYAEQGLEILDFPCNQFREQAPESSGEIEQVCKTKFGTEFKIFDKIEVNGPNAAPLYIYLKTQKPEDKGNHVFKDFLLKLASLGEKREGSDIKWNFTKFLVSRDGEVVERFAPSVPPSEITDDIQILL
ncbi:glutathione peroxidase [Neisseria chenwenguii]|uniref:Glutathione peroxidase n=1 Tax=Neisseria chenwenguii TaxID=1853278 RepID=A0A220S0I4_9NEIS|nr:glutathione peroxidase [Neisseria chenwenguii]ASK26725.1 glutathione peroxidase [Neisseria chenwenguii]ROV56387.1 glutathione peroxidase [Neisseria chenwenguii]